MSKQVFILVPVAVTIDSDDNIKDIALPNFGDLNELYKVGGAYPDISTATAALLEHVPHSPY